MMNNTDVLLLLYAVCHQIVNVVCVRSARVCVRAAVKCMRIYLVNQMQGPACDHPVAFCRLNDFIASALKRSL